MRSVLAAAGLLLATSLPAQEEALSIPAYADALRGIQEHLEAGRLDEARQQAHALGATQVDWAGERLATDSTLSEAVAGVGTEAAARSLGARIRRLIAALPKESGEAATEAAPRPEDLARLTLPDDLEAGGDVSPIPLKPLSVPERIAETLVAAYDWVAKQFNKLLDWLDRLRPRSRQSTSDLGGTAIAAIVVVAAAVFILALLALRTLRRARMAPVEAESDRILSSSKDDDPLSRETNEWESRARELAAAGRWREAIRAWYHAVLVGLFRAGLVHYQKGRTNWEYAARLAPDLVWRPAFLDLTRLFDREWYGSTASGPEAAGACARFARTILRDVRGAGEAA